MGSETKPFHFRFAWTLAQKRRKFLAEVIVQFSSAGGFSGNNCLPCYSFYTFSDKNFWRHFVNVR